MTNERMNERRFCFSIWLAAAAAERACLYVYPPCHGCTGLYLSTYVTVRNRTASPSAAGVMEGHTKQARTTWRRSSNHCVPRPLQGGGAGERMQTVLHGCSHGREGRVEEAEALSARWRPHCCSACCLAQARAGGPLFSDFLSAGAWWRGGGGLVAPGETPEFDGAEILPFRPTMPGWNTEPDPTLLCPPRRLVQTLSASPCPHHAPKCVRVCEWASGR